MALGGRLRRGSKPQSAFTLIEVLAVVAITGIILAVAAVNLFPSNAQVARREAGNVALAIEHARDTAWFGGLPTAVTFSEGRVKKWRLSGSQWAPDPAKDQRLEDDVRVLAMHMDGHALAAGERLVFLPDGIGTAFRVALEVRGHAWAVEGDASGSVRLVGP
jgi:general secretion pathway protein H